MRKYKGFGKEWARRWRVREEEKQAAEKARRVAPVYAREQSKEASEKRSAKVVITLEQVKEKLFDLGYRGRTTGRVRRKVGEMLKFDRRDTWT